jgi:hypothetical protein
MNKKTLDTVKHTVESQSEGSDCLRQCNMYLGSVLEPRAQMQTLRKRSSCCPLTTGHFAPHRDRLLNGVIPSLCAKFDIVSAATQDFSGYPVARTQMRTHFPIVYQEVTNCGQ